MAPEDGGGGETGARDENREYMISELGRTLGVTPRAIRFYEDRGLLSPRRVGSTRIYGVRERARLQLILRGKRLGFSLDEIGELLDLYDMDENHVAQLETTLQKGRRRIAELERQRDDIAATLAELRHWEGVVIGLLQRNGIDAIER